MRTPLRPSIDWWQVVVDLERCGYTLAAMAAAVGVASSTLKGWKNLGAEPGHSAGERLVALWCHVRREEPEQAPRTVRTISAARMAPKKPRRQLPARSELGDAVCGWVTGIR